MSTPSPKRIHNLKDFADFLLAVGNEGFEYVVIGGCAVAAYSHLGGESCFTEDLDLYASRDSLGEIVEWAKGQSEIEVLKTPQPRSLQVAVLHWGALEINVLVSSPGLPSPPQASRNARVFKIKERSLLRIPVIDPYDLLRNKIAVNRPKDQPHIELLERFLEEEVLVAFRSDQEQRERFRPARDLMDVHRSRRLHERLFARLLPHGRTPADYRFLVNHAPSTEQARAVIEGAKPVMADELESILRRSE
jgi:hypothetical protein